MFVTRDSLPSTHSTTRPTHYTPYFRKPIWACSPDADALAPPIFDTGNMMIAAPHSLGTTGMMDPLAHSRSTRFHFVGHAYLVQETAALPHDVTACSTQTELQKLGLFTFAADSSLKVAHGNFVSASCGSAASYSLGHCLSDMTNKSQPSRAKPHTRGFAKDVALRNSVPMVPPGLGHVIPPSVARPGYVSQTASSGVSEGRSGTQGLFSQCGSDGVATVVTASSAVSERSGSGAIPWVVAPQTPDRNGIATAFSSLSAHFMYSLAIKARADEVFPDPQFDGRNYVTSIVGTRIRFILESVSNPQVVVIHALWYISKITTKDMGHGSDFLGVSIFNHLYCCGVATLDELLFSAFVIVARLADKWVNDCCLASKTWEKTTAIPSSTLTNVEKTALMSLDYVVNIPRSALHGWILGLRAPSSGLAGDNSAIILRILDDVLAINEATEVNTTFMRYRGRKKKTAATPHQELPVIHVPTPVKPLTCLPDPSDWCPQADPVVNKNSRMSDWCPEADPIVKRNPRTMGIAPGSHNFVHELRQPTTALDLLELITQGTWGAAVGGPLSTIGAHFAHTVGRYGPCQTILG